MSLKRWAVCCPGPSLLLRKTTRLIHQYDPESIIAVNGAVLLDTVKFDYWAIGDCEVMDSVANKLKMLRRRFDYDMTLWIADYWPAKIHSEFSHLQQHFREFRKNVFGSRKDSIANLIPFAKELNTAWQDYTIFSAIALAILHGANDIRVFGADMRGEGYFTRGLENSRTQHHERRWEQERNSFEQLRIACMEEGIFLSR